MSRSIVLDTSAFSAVLRKDPATQARLIEELSAGVAIIVSPVVYYELRRGLLKRDAHRLLDYFERLVASFPWADLTRGDWEEAARLWAKTQKIGRPRGDADLLIAAQANRRGAIVVTDNVKDFRGIADVLETWS